VYYLERGAQASTIFQFARQIEAQYDQLGFLRLRNRPNEEPLISVGIAKFGSAILPDDGTVKADAMHWINVQCDVFKGKVAITNAAGRHASPTILHFNDRFTTLPPYTSEALRLKLLMRYGFPKWLARIFATIFVEYPKNIELRIKDLLRPIYRRLFGFRRIRSARP
jgi:hypothetical protein